MIKVNSNLTTRLIIFFSILAMIAHGQKKKPVDMLTLSNDQKKYSEENLILKLPDSQLSLSQTISRNAYDGGKYILRIHILDTSTFKTKAKINLVDTTILVATFSTGSETPLEYLDEYKIQGEIELLSFNKNRITINQNIKVFGIRRKNIYHYKSKKTFIDITPWD